MIVLKTGVKVALIELVNLQNAKLYPRKSQSYRSLSDITFNIHPPRLL